MAFAEHVGGDKHSQFVGSGDFVPHLVGFRAESTRKRRRIVGVASDNGKTLKSARQQLLVKVSDCICELREDEYLLIWMFLGEQLFEFGKFLILGRLPISSKLQNRKQPLGVIRQLALQILNKGVRT